MIEELIQRVFNTRNASHLEHWRTKSFSAHMALGDFYDSVIEAIDSLVEDHQGVFENVDVSEIPAMRRPKSIVAMLEDDLTFIADNRAKIVSKLPALDNKLQELESVYMKALYKLNKLS